MPNTAAKPMPWFVLYAAAPFVAMFREVLEMRYLWKIDFRLDNAKLVAFLDAEPHTPLDRALNNTLVSMECLQRGADISSNLLTGKLTGKTVATTISFHTK